MAKNAFPACHLYQDQIGSRGNFTVIFNESHLQDNSCANTIYFVLERFSQSKFHSLIDDISIGQFYNRLSRKVLKKPTDGMALNKSPSNFPSFRRKILTMHCVIHTQLPKFFLLFREKDLDLRPFEAMLMGYAKRGACVEQDLGDFATRKKNTSQCCSDHGTMQLKWHDCRKLYSYTLQLLKSSA